MATTKPKTTKAAAAKKPTASTAKRKTTPKATAVKTTVKSTKASPSGLKSFRLSSSPRPFLTFSITRDTIYWLILSVAILALGSWVVNLQVKINDIYDKIDQEQVISDNLDAQYLKALETKRAQKN